MPEEIGADGRRILFRSEYRGEQRRASKSQRTALAEALLEMERSGCCPVLDDGKTAGNAAMWIDEDTMLVSPSGRVAGPTDEQDFVEVSHFDCDRWCAHYRSPSATRQPSSDTPLHWAALMEAQSHPHATATPRYSLHGHALGVPEAAKTLGLPLSMTETRFSTPEDREALLQLLRDYPYPQHRVWIRRGHGFFILHDSLASARALARDLAGRAQALGFLG